LERAVHKHPIFFYFRKAFIRNVFIKYQKDVNMMGKIRLKFGVIALSVILLAIVFSTSHIFFIPSNAQGLSGTIYMEPPNNIYSLNNATLGTKFNVTIWVKNTTLVGGAQASIEFNDTVLNVTRWFMPTWDPNFFMPQTPYPPSALPAPPNPGYLHLHLGRGRVLVAVSKGGLPPGEPWGHNGTIAIFEFNITKVPTVPGPKLTSVLKLNSTDTFLLDTTATELNGTIIRDGSYTFIPEFPAVYALVAFFVLSLAAVIARKKVFAKPKFKRL
jgi:hypothetical protein